MATASSPNKALEGQQVSISTRGHSVRINAPREIMHNIKLVRLIEDRIFKDLGHAQCRSGFDLNWRMRDVINPAQLLR